MVYAKFPISTMWTVTSATDMRTYWTCMRCGMLIPPCTSPMRTKTNSSRPSTSNLNVTGIASKNVSSTLSSAAAGSRELRRQSAGYGNCWHRIRPMSSYGRCSTAARRRFPRTRVLRRPRMTGFGSNSPAASRPSWVTRSAASPAATRMRSSKSTSTAAGLMTSGGSKTSSRPLVSPPHLSSNCAARSSSHWSASRRPSPG